jgi:inorganic triphosphatase YgiF
MYAGADEVSTGGPPRLAALLPGGTMEIEFKLMASPAALHGIAGSSLVSRAAVGPVRRQALLNRYFDTPDFRLRRAGLTLRVRGDGEAWVQGLKVRDGGADGLFRRMEWERSVPGDVPELEALFGQDGALAGLGVAAADVGVVFTTRFLRITHALAVTNAADLPDTRFSLALDEGAIETGTRREPLAEVELELEAGPETGMVRFAALLRRDFALVAGTLSKAERGFRLVGMASPRSREELR